MNCTKCKNQINSQRIKALPDTKVCVDCSTTEQVGCVDITYHKTGNTIQVMDKETCLDYIHNQYDNKLISSNHTYNLRTIINALFPTTEPIFTVKEQVIDEEIQYAFKNWKNT